MAAKTLDPLGNLVSPGNDAFMSGISYIYEGKGGWLWAENVRSAWKFGSTFLPNNLVDVSCSHTRIP
jgi:hypothetical protein